MVAMRKVVSVGKVSGEGRRQWRPFRDWLEEVKANGGNPAGVYPITHLLLPNRYPQATVVFWVDGEDVGVKRSVQPQEWNAILQAMGAIPGKPIKGFSLWLEISENGEVNVLLDDNTNTVYVPTSYGWEMV